MWCKKVEEIFENGIVLSGGGSAIYGLDTMVAKVFDIKTTLAVERLKHINMLNKNK